MRTDLTPYGLEQRKKQLALRREVRRQPIVKLTGVMLTDSAFGTISKGDRVWTFGLTLAAWRMNDGEINRRDLKVETLTSQGMVTRYMRLLSGGYPLVTMRAHLFDQNSSDQSLAWMDGAPRTGIRDRALAAVRTELKRPVRRRVRGVGTLSFDRPMGKWQGKSRWNGRFVRVQIEARDNNNPAPEFDLARALIGSLEQWLLIARLRAVRDYLKNYNAEWAIEANEPPLTRDQFMARLSPDALWIGPGNRASMSLNDDGLLGWHMIDVPLDLKQGKARRSTLIG